MAKKKRKSVTDKLKWKKEGGKLDCGRFFIGRSKIDGIYYLYRSSGNYIGGFDRLKRAKYIAQEIHNG